MRLSLEEKQTHNEALGVIFNKYHSDADFAKQLIDSPEQALKDMGADYSVDGDKTIVFEDQSDPNTVYFNIPQAPNFDTWELTDEQLEVVSGGAHSYNSCYCIKPTVNIISITIKF
jgi:hypothetical protein